MLTPQTANEIISLLVPAGLLERRQDDGDRRLRRMFVTGAGRDLLSRAGPAVHAVERRMTSSLSQGDLAVLRGWLTDPAPAPATSPPSPSRNRPSTPPDITEPERDTMTTLAHTRTGAGAPLVLLHGIGSSRRAWDPVIPALGEQFDVIAVDLPGFGDSEPLPPGVEPRPAALAAAVAGLIDDLGITTPT